MLHFNMPLAAMPLAAMCLPLQLTTAELLDGNAAAQQMRNEELLAQLAGHEFAQTECMLDFFNFGPKAVAAPSALHIAVSGDGPCVLCGGMPLRVHRRRRRMRVKKINMPFFFIAPADRDAIF
jgi:hypothetical protein